MADRYSRGSFMRRAGGASGGPSQRGLKSYVSQQSGSRRHQYTSALSTVNTIAAGSYGVVNLLRFQRTFDSATGDDIPPTATASNNYQSPDVFNGSRISNYSAKLQIKNTSSSKAFTLDVFEVSLSFYDALVWNTVLTSNCPVQFDTTAPTDPPYDLRGRVTTKTPAIGLVSNNAFNNFKIIQHYMKYRGPITLGASDGSPTPQVEININRVPRKNRRSNMGNYWGLIILNDSDKNGAGIFSGEATLTASFDELPSDNRLPYVY